MVGSVCGVSWLRFRRGLTTELTGAPANGWCVRAREAGGVERMVRSVMGHIIQSNFRCSKSDKCCLHRIEHCLYSPGSDNLIVLR